MDGSTQGYTFDATDRPKNAIQLGENANGIEIIINHTDGSATDGYDGQMFLFGAAEGTAPSELLADVSITLGTARVSDDTLTTGQDPSHELWVDTMVVTSGHVSTFSSTDSGKNRICKLSGDLSGLRYIWPSFNDITDAAAVCLASGVINGYYRVW